MKVCQAKKFARDLQGAYVPTLLENLYPMEGPAVEVVRESSVELERTMADMVNNPLFTQALPYTLLYSTREMKYYFQIQARAIMKKSSHRLAGN
jgi:hypothetical protein